MTGVELIGIERKRQIEMGFTPEHDLECHAVFDLLNAATNYMNQAYLGGEPVSELAKAGALIAAAIDRIQNGEK